MGIFAFLIKNKTLVMLAILGMIIAGQTVYISMLRSDKVALTAEKAQLKTLLDVSQANVIELQGNIKTQNDAIDVLKKNGDARVAKHAEEVKKANDVANTYKKRAEELLKRKPPQGIPRCDAANALINEEIRNAKK